MERTRIARARARTCTYTHTHTRGSSLFILQSPSSRTAGSLNGLRNHTLGELAKGRRERETRVFLFLLLPSVAESAGRAPQPIVALRGATDRARTAKAPSTN